MKKISVIGSGTMGNGIAQVFALNGHEVSMIDVNTEALKKGLLNIGKSLERMLIKDKITATQKEEALNRVSISTSSEKCVDSDLVIEAATERLDLKLQLFDSLDGICQPDCILASNTSSISITRLASVTKRPDKVIGMHFMNPVPIMKLVEIIKGYNTSEATCKTIKELSIALGKIPIEVNDYPGFVANRILMPMINEAIYTLHEGVAGVAEIDSVMKLGMAHPMGPLQLADFIGLDVCKAILDVLYQGFKNPKYGACPLLVNMVRARKLGRKTGEGFYDYSDKSKNPKVSPSFS